MLVIDCVELQTLHQNHDVMHFDDESSIRSQQQVHTTHDLVQVIYMRKDIASSDDVRFSELCSDSFRNYCGKIVVYNLQTPLPRNLYNIWSRINSKCLDAHLLEWL